MKLGGSQPTQTPAEEPAMPSNNVLDFGNGMETPQNAAPSAAPAPNPLEKEPFDAGIEADEESDPKKFIQQLTGKLGQSLRAYNQKQGQPDLELEKFAINSLLSATHTSEMDDSDKQDIIKKIESSGDDNQQVSEPKKEPVDDNQPEDNNQPEENSGNMFEDAVVYENENFMLSKPKKNNMFQEGSNDILDEMKPCWKGYKQVGMKDKGGKEVPNCVPVNENMGESNNYMFFNNLKTIHEAITNLLKMDQSAVDKILSDGHGWALDHLATSADDIEEVYHFLNATLSGEDGYNGNTPDGYSDEHGSVEHINMNEAEYKGKKVTLGKPSHGDVKKFKVYVKNSKGNVVKVNFGDPNMEIKRDDPERKKSFRARHKCSQAHDRTTPKYWSCKMWSSTPVSKMVAEDLTKSNKSGIFADMIKTKLTETFNTENMAEPFIEPLVKPKTEPTVKPKTTPKPKRKDAPFLPNVAPSIQPQPKAKK